VAQDSRVTDPQTGQSAAFAELVAAAAALPVPDDAPLRPDAELVRVGTDQPLVDGPAYVTGQATYAADVRLPGMLVAVVARPPVFGGSVRRYDPSRALAVPGVRSVVEIPRFSGVCKFQPLGGVAVVADTTWAALKGRAALLVEWDPGEHADYDSAAYAAELSALVAKPGGDFRERGDAERALDEASRVVDAEYHVPHLVHLPMEPPAALARFDGKRCEIWACTQDPQGAQTEVAEQLGLSERDVTVHVTFLGGGFGRKSKPDFVVEAAFVAREVGAPVRVQWTREDELRHAYYHSTCTQRLTAGLDADGRVVAWRQRVAFPSIASIFAPFGLPIGPVASELQQGLTDLALDVPHVRMESHHVPAKVRIGWMRAVHNVNAAFATQSFVDELAVATGRDPRDVLLELIGPARHVSLAELGVGNLPNYGQDLAEHPVDAGRLRAVVERVTASADWAASRAAGRALGLAAHRSFLAYVAVVVSVVRGDDGGIVVDEAWICADAGTVINTDRVRAQLEGAVIFASSSALHGEVTAKGGEIEQRGFRDHRLVRMPQAPRAIHVDLVRSAAPPAGVGEPGVPPVAPALANAVFALTGVRVRRLPVLRRGVFPPAPG
jgi:isoquinoline 1-oxidoreductase beta subunit